MISKTLLIFILVNFVLYSYGQQNKKFFRKDYHFIESLKGFYKFHTVMKTWTDAKRVCALESATLYYPETKKEASEVSMFVNNTQTGVQWWWIGISDMLVEGVFETVDGRPISEVYVNWVELSQPDSFGGVAACVNNMADIMNVHFCTSKSYFICKKDLESLEWNNHCNMPNLDYVYNQDNGNCYKLHTTPSNWTEAYAACRLEQSSLAMISNTLKADYLVKLVESTSKPKVKGIYQKGIFHLGFHNRISEHWLTVKGRPIRVGADAWLDNHRPEVDDPQECGAMFYTGRLVNIDCGTKTFFICEHEIDKIDIPNSASFSDSEQYLLEPYVGGGVE